VKNSDVEFTYRKYGIVVEALTQKGGTLKDEASNVQLRIKYSLLVQQMIRVSTRLLISKKISDEMFFLCGDINDVVGRW
jgi:hypothetical protein